MTNVVLDHGTIDVYMETSVNRSLRTASFAYKEITSAGKLLQFISDFYLRTFTSFNDVIIDSDYMTSNVK